MKRAWVLGVWAIWLAGLGPLPAHAQTDASKLRAVYTPEAPLIDGKLDEAAWQQAPRISNFTQRELTLGAPVSERTEVAVLYDDQKLYIGVWCYDSRPDKLIARELRRDFDFSLDDNFIIIIDTYHDKRNGFMFVTNPVAARADLQVFNNGGSTNAFWNGVWDVRTTITEEGWFAEFEIPFYTLKYRVGIEEQIWGINFERNIRRKREQARWQGWSRDNQIQQVNLAGQLIGLNELTQKQFVEIKPYGIGGGEITPEGSRPTGNLGGDINYLLSPTYRLNLTFNTDFAQVEADQQQVNITRFPLFFPELREFFLEGDDFFNFGFGGNRIIPFYTRRIGLDQNREAVPIIAGARLLGKEDDRTLGLMSIQTAATASQQSTNYTTASWRQDVGRQSVIGAMTTNKITADRWHSSTGINGRYSTSRFLGYKNLDIGGALINTYNTDEGFNPGATAYRFFISYPNDKFSIFTSAQRGPEDFEPEVGLMLRRSFREQFVDFSFKPRPKKYLTWIRQYEFKPAQITNTQYDDNGQIQSFNYNFQYLGFDTKSGESFTLNHALVAEGLRAPFTIARDVVIPEGMYWWRQSNARFRTFRGRLLALDSRMSWGEFYNGNSLQTQTELLWRSSRYFGLSLRYEHNNVALPVGSFQTNLIGSRITYALNPNLFGSLLSQWNSAQNEFNINFRLQFIPIIGTDFFLIVNQVFDTQTGQLDPSRGTVLGKLIWRFVV
ncbi:MAG: DUF5916 domain-containing protein [Bacteroidia bacterium]